MSLKQFKTSAKAASSGVWVSYGTNSDGTEIKFRLARLGSQNRDYMKALEEATRPHRRAIELGTFPPEEDRKLTLELFAKHVLIGWEHVQPNDGGSKDELPYNYQNVVKLLSDPDWSDLYDKLREDAARAVTFRDDALDSAVKNS